MREIKGSGGYKIWLVGPVFGLLLSLFWPTVFPGLLFAFRFCGGGEMSSNGCSNQQISFIMFTFNFILYTSLWFLVLGIGKSIAGRELTKKGK